jgi:hypothetical protein
MCIIQSDSKSPYTYMPGKVLRGWKLFKSPSKHKHRKRRTWLVCPEPCSLLLYTLYRVIKKSLYTHPVGGGLVCPELCYLLLCSLYRVIKKSLYTHPVGGGLKWAEPCNLGYVHYTGWFRSPCISVTTSFRAESNSKVPYAHRRWCTWLGCNAERVSVHMDLWITSTLVVTGSQGLVSHFYTCYRFTGTCHPLLHVLQVHKDFWITLYLAYPVRHSVPLVRVFSCPHRFYSSAS